ncbi:MAG: AraC family transcriptional regulator [Candidatus Cryptobacteroides sp.]|nr:AraC family transcriptional regulator [Bacteroidales bacterium]
MSKKLLKYLVANEADPQWGLVVTTVGQQDIIPGSIYPSQDHPMRYLFSSEKGRIFNEYQLVYISRGKGQFVSASQKKTNVSAGDLFILFPGEWHNYSPDSTTGWHESWIGFTGPDMDEKVNSGFFSRKHPILHVGLDDDIFSLFHQGTVAAAGQKANYQQHLAGIAGHLLGLAYSKGNNMYSQQDEVDELISRAKIMFQDNLENGITGEEIAREIGTSYTRFRKLFKEYTGFSPKQYLQELKVAKAKQLLTNTSLSCQQIGFDSGFESPSFFHCTFKKRTGMSPADYRKLTQGDSDEWMNTKE